MSYPEYPASLRSAPQPRPAAPPADDIWRWVAVALIEDAAKLPEESRIALAQGLLARAGHKVETFDFVPELREVNRRVHLAHKIVSRLAGTSVD